MKKAFITLTMFWLTLIIVLFMGCQKTANESLISPEKHVQLVSDSIAKVIAENFNPVAFFNTDNSTNHSPVKSKLNGHNTVKNIVTIKDSYATPAIYICNFTDNQGFLFVSADFQLAPIIAYIEMGEFKKDKVPATLVSWADKTLKNIETVRKGIYDNTMEAKTAWDNYLDQNKIVNTSARSTLQSAITTFYIKVLPGDPLPPPTCVPTYQTITVGPLLPITWGQSCTYNELCALDQNFNCNLGCGNGRPYTGCVATSSAQIVRYWQPTLTQNYNYSSMPTNHGNTDVERLMADLGKSVFMSYGCDASSALSSYVPGALATKFSRGSPDRGDYQWWVTAANLDNH